MDGLTLAVYTFTIICLSGLSDGLDCWVCIAPDCDSDPDVNYKATRTTCAAGGECQKTYYRFFSEADNKEYETTVRSCSLGNCEPRDDFTNCTKDRMTFPGCVRKHCCNDVSLCNQATLPHFSTSLTIFTVCCSVISNLVTKMFKNH